MDDQPGTMCKVEFSSTDGFQETYELTKLRMTLGAHTDADIGYPGLSFEHAELLYDDGHWIIRKRNPESIMRFRGQPIELKKLNPGDRVFLGAGVLTFLGSSNEEITAITMLYDLSNPIEPFRMTILNGQEKGRIIELKPGEYTLGRVENPNVRSANIHRHEFNHRFVSRSHARVFVERCCVKIQDLDSTNGTRINGHMVKTGALVNGDILTLGKLKIRITGPVNPAKISVPTVPVRLRDTTWTRILWLYVVPFSLLLLLAALYLFDSIPGL